jgi:hypothetical protein
MAADARAAGEYAPPAYEQGLPLFEAEKYKALRRNVPGFPPIDSVPPLRSRDAVRLLQWHAPGRVLGRFPDTPQLRRDAVIASDLVELDRAVKLLQATVSTAWATDSLVHEVESARPISFYLDLPGTPEWIPITQQPGVHALSSHGGPFVSASSSAG